MQDLRPQLKLLSGQTLVILGFGAIGRRLAELLAPFDMNVIAVRRTIRGDESVKVVEVAHADSVLPLADHVVNILPASAENHGYFDGDRLRALKKGVVIYNIGRGITIHQDALIDGLKAGHLAAAYLDVTDPEPLPPDDPLWTAPNCYIPPHIGGGLHNEKERQILHFLQNLERFLNGKPLRNRIIYKSCPGVARIE